MECHCAQPSWTVLWARARANQTSTHTHTQTHSREKNDSASHDKSAAFTIVSDVSGAHVRRFTPLHSWMDSKNSNVISLLANDGINIVQACITLLRLRIYSVWLCVLAIALPTTFPLHPIVPSIHKWINKTVNKLLSHWNDIILTGMQWGE